MSDRSAVSRVQVSDHIDHVSLSMSLLPFFFFLAEDEKMNNFTLATAFN